MCGFFGFEDFAPSQIWLNFPFGSWTIVHGDQKIKLAQRIMQVEVGVNTCKPILVGLASLVLKILLLFLPSEMAKIYLWTVVKKSNQLESAQKFMQVGIDVTCIQNNFGGHSLFSFGDITTFKNGFWTMYSPWSSKKKNRL